MGLDCTAYSKLVKLDEKDCIFEDDSDYPLNGVKFHLNPHFPESAKDILEDDSYFFSKKFEWRAGSYSSYCQFINWLGSIGTGDDFKELINFSDCEGTLGTEVCQKLLIDFQKNSEKVFSIKNYDSEYYKNSYQNWFDALTIAADGGAISFH